MKALLAATKNYYFWVILGLFGLCTFLYYPQLILWGEEGPFRHLERLTIQRILFLLPVTCSGMAFGLKGGYIGLTIALAIMLPQALLWSPVPGAALLETAAVAAIGALTTWWLDARHRKVGRREQALLKLDSLRQELNSYLQIITESEKRLSILHSITRIINQSFTLEEILNAAADKIKEVLNIDGVLLFLMDERDGRLYLKAQRGFSAEFAHQVTGLQVGEGFNGWVAQTGKPCLVEDSTADSRLSRDAIKQEGIRTQFIVPLTSRDQVVGTLCVAARQVTHFTTEERDLLTLIGAELGVALQKAALYEESERSRTRLKELFERAHDAIWTHDLEGRITTANRAASELVGYELEEVVGEHVFKFLTTRGQERARKVRKRLLSGDEMRQPYEQTIIRKDGTLATATITTSLLTEQGVPIAFQHIARDVTAERRLQENLRLYVQQITRAQEEERKRIARELHDDSIQSLIALSRQIEEMTANHTQLPEAQILEEIRENIDAIIAGMRRFIKDLRPPTLEFLGLLPALRELICQLSEEQYLDVRLVVNGNERLLAPEDELLNLPGDPRGLEEYLEALRGY